LKNMMGISCCLHRSFCERSLARQEAILVNIFSRTESPLVILINANISLSHLPDNRWFTVGLRIRGYPEAAFRWRDRRKAWDLEKDDWGT
jgi:hypothetical protein